LEKDVNKLERFMSDTVECPYCKYENEVTDFEGDDSIYACQNESCGKEFTVRAEYTPVYYAYKYCKGNKVSFNWRLIGEQVGGFMKLLIVINDSFRLANHYQYCGATCALDRRTIEIELTPEQEKLISLGRNGDGSYWEAIESVTLKGAYENN
jgi:ribosomal protein L37AE/L43A